MSKRTNKTASQAMKLAHEIKDGFFTFSEALKKAWYLVKKQTVKAVEDFNTALDNSEKCGLGIFRFVYDNEYAAFNYGEPLEYYVYNGEKRTYFDCMNAALRFLLKKEGFLA